MDLHMSSLGALEPEGLWCVFYATRHQVYWGPINVSFAGTLIWYHKQHKHKPREWQTSYSGTSRPTHPYKYIFTPPVMCSHQYSLLHGMNNSLMSKI